MNINKIIKEEIDEFDWIRDVPAGIPVNKDREYQIQVCGDNAHRYEEVLDKLEQLYGKNATFLVRGYIKDSSNDDIDDGFIFYVEGISPDGKFRNVEYNSCSARNDYPNYSIVGIDNFMNYIIA